MVNITRASAHGISEKNRRLLTSLHRGTSGPFTATEAAASLSVDIGPEVPRLPGEDGLAHTRPAGTVRYRAPGCC